MRILKILCAFLIAVSLFATPATHAHDLLPQAVIDYMRQHPDATLGEVEAYIQRHPELQVAQDSNQARLIQLARDSRPDFLMNCWRFFVLGIGHILSGPDHILFVCSLLLTFVTFRKTAWLLSCFTLSHSITLILAGSHLLRVSSLIVEPLIAFSIAYVAITTIFLAPRYRFFAHDRAKALTVLGFGFFHGMGFAGALQDIAVPSGAVPFLASILSFNVGVDVGQLIIVGAALPFIYVFRHARWYPRSVRVFALVISALALTWMAQRIVDV